VEELCKPLSIRILAPYYRCSFYTLLAISGQKIASHPGCQPGQNGLKMALGQQFRPKADSCRCAPGTLTTNTWVEGDRFTAGVLID